MSLRARPSYMAAMTISKIPAGLEYLDNSGQTTKGSSYLRAAATTAHTKENYLAASITALSNEREVLALIAVAHSLLVISYHMLDQRVDCRELGSYYFDHLQRQTQQQRLVKKLETMGLKVTVGVLPKAACVLLNPIFIADTP